MRNVRFARALMALALATPVAFVAPPATAQETSYATVGQSEQARSDMLEAFGMVDLAPGQYKWASDIPAAGPTKIVISLTDQMGYVYRAGQLVGVTTVSSGKTDHETPTGVFPILGKEKVHHSKTYDNASMPYMQRLNSYGVALHGGNNPGYAASHGCIRLPMKFAARLFTLTQTGSPVIIEA
jgi:lipoprotein-anchoring transpeptidase ErfK/SrfK